MSNILYPPALYRITVSLSLLVLLICGCNSLPPASPVEADDSWFDPRYMTWEPVQQPEVLSKNWYKNGTTFLGVENQVLRLGSNDIENWSIDSAASYYRLIFQFGDSYQAIYLNQISDDSLRYMYANISTQTPQELADIPASGSWQLLTSTIYWYNTGMIPAGTWHKSLGELELDISPLGVEIDGTLWEILQSQSDANYKRLILGNIELDSLITMYYKNPTSKYLFILVQQGLSDNRDLNGVLTGQWITLKRWYDFFELSGWRDGAAITYDVNYESLDAILTSVESSYYGIRDSLYLREKILGELTLSFSGDITGNGQGMMELNAQFSPSQIRGNRQLMHVTPIGWENTIETLEKSDWYDADLPLQASYAITMERDSLWIDLPSGKTLLTTHKIDDESVLNMSPFVFPFQQRVSLLADSLAIAVPVLNPGEFSRPTQFVRPQPYDTFDVTFAGLLSQLIEAAYGRRVGYIHDYYSRLTQDRGMDLIHFVLGVYDRRGWISRPEDEDVPLPYTDEVVIEFELK